MKRRICILLVLAMMGNMLVFATGSDSIEALSSYGFVEGDPDGSIRPEDKITRAEYAKLIYKINFGDMVPYGVGNSFFADLDEGHWAKGYIDVLKMSDLLEGDENGNFLPEENIIYADAIKMLIKTLGYEPVADAMGGYPDGYIMAASRYGIAENRAVTNEEVSRGEAFDMIYKALDIPLMDQTVFGEDAEYVIYDGKNDMPLVTIRTRNMIGE